ncbi:MAG: hypothetical protein EKK41_12790 [Hyphomicrobiales bacterium]|nr:MAG: hypothetical protein EKK41_12790 [Hyphomicrobiales bacterium]
MTKKKNPTAVEPAEISKAEINERLAKLGIATVLIGYDGCGDSGCIESVEARGADNQKIELPKKLVSITLQDWNYDSDKPGYVVTRTVKRKVPIQEAIENWCYHLLEDHFPGWELNEGSQGTIEFDIAKKSAEFEHGENVYTTHTRRLVV